MMKFIITDKKHIKDKALSQIQELVIEMGFKQVELPIVAKGDKEGELRFIRFERVVKEGNARIILDSLHGATYIYLDDKEGDMFLTYYGQIEDYKDLYIAFMMSGLFEENEELEELAAGYMVTQIKYNEEDTI